MLERGLDLGPRDSDVPDPAAVEAAVKGATIRLDDDGRVHVDGVLAGDRVREPRVTQRVSAVSAVPGVRALLTAEQRRFGRGAQPGLVAEGRDLATVVFPRARHRFYLDAGVEVRAERRRRELLATGRPAPALAELIAEIEARDAHDRRRKVAPLCIGAGVEVFDTSDLDVEQVVEKLARRLRRGGPDGA